MFLKVKCYSNWLADVQSYHIAALWCMKAVLQPMMGWKFEEFWKWKEHKRSSFQKGLLWFNSLSMAGHQQPWRKAYYTPSVSWTGYSNCLQPRETFTRYCVFQPLPDHLPAKKCIHDHNLEEMQSRLFLIPFWKCCNHSISLPYHSRNTVLFSPATKLSHS